MNNFVKEKLIEVKKVIKSDFVLLDHQDRILYKSSDEISTNGWHLIHVSAYKLLVKEKITDQSHDFINIILSVLDSQIKEIKPDKWFTLLNGDCSDLDDFDIKYKNQTDISVWIILADDIAKYLNEFKLLFELSIAVVVKENKLAVIHFGQYDNDDVEGILDYIEGELMVKGKIIIGNTVNSINDVSKSYFNANHLMKYIFRTNSSKSIFKFENMLIENLIGKLDNEKLEHTYLEYCKINDIEKLNLELIETIRCFFENNLNITDTAASLFLHRNTLIYRINRVETLTGLDIRKFEDALKIKILILIKNNV